VSREAFERPISARVDPKVGCRAFFPTGCGVVGGVTHEHRGLLRAFKCRYVATHRLLSGMVEVVG